jgi:23S rRNA (adenine2503-C2)-methyltransferase
MIPPASSDSSDSVNLFGFDRERIAATLARFDAPGFHAGQVYRWIYGKGRFDVEAWTDLPRDLRSALSRVAHVDPGALAGRAVASDGTVKYRARLAGGGEVECVYLVQSERVTLCVSSQVGCALGCDFCLTARMGLVRQMDAGEIAGQVALIRRDRDLSRTPINLVFMGMGEPLHNYDAVLAAIRLLTDTEGFAIPARRITVSTSGLAPAIERLAAEARRPRLAVSLNATTDAVRDRLMPINRRYPIDRLLEACRRFRDIAEERFTFEYVLLAGINDGDDDIARLAGIVRRCGAKLNLIPFNAVPEWLDYRPPERSRIVEFRDRLLRRGAPASIRWSRGADARAACGQLALLDAGSAEGSGSEGAR